MRIKSIAARHIINGKGQPTLQIEVSTSKCTAVSSVPLAASKSKYEFSDHYDKLHLRYHEETLDSVNEKIKKIVAPELIGKNSMDQKAVDQLLLDVDSTLDRTHLGVQLLTAISQCVAKIGALESDLPLFKYLRVLYDYSENTSVRLNSEYNLPIPVLTVSQSSAHNTKNRLPAQEILILPKNTFYYGRDLVRMYEFLSKIDFSDTDHNVNSYLAHLSQTLQKSKFKFSLGLDMAASRFKREDSEQYVIPHFATSKVSSNYSLKKLVESYSKMVKEFNLTFLEDLLAEDDYSGWKELHDKLQSNSSIQLVSDDFTATNLERLEKIALLECANNVIIKPTQAGTVSECIQFAQRAHKHNMNITVSYRHGETEDTFISDLAVGINAKYFRSGFYTGSEHVSKLNRLLQIEDSI